MKEWLKTELKRCMFTVLTAVITVSGFGGEITARAETETGSQSAVWEYSVQKAAATFVGQLPEKVQSDGIEQAVTWSMPSTDKFSDEYGTVTVNGTLEDGKEMKALVEVVSENMRYFINCMADVTENPYHQNEIIDVPSAPYEAIAAFMQNQNTLLINEKMETKNEGQGYRILF